MAMEKSDRLNLFYQFIFVYISYGKLKCSYEDTLDTKISHYVNKQCLSLCMQGN